MITAEGLIAKLQHALQIDGDFPASAQVIAELRQLISDPKTTAEQITEVILKEPSLGIRVLHFVNSAFMRRSKPIMTVSQAVIQIGMKPLADLCSGLVLMQKFVPVARRSSPFAYCLKKTLLVSLLSSSFSSSVASQHSKHQHTTKDESGYLMGQLAELGQLLLGFYFPEILEAAFKRAQEKNQDLSESIKELTGLHPFKLSSEVISALGLPKFFAEVLDCSDITKIAGPDSHVSESQIQRSSKILHAAVNVGAAIASGRSKVELDAKLKGAQELLGLPMESLHQTMTGIKTIFQDHCSSLDMELPGLPEFLTSYSKDKPAEANTEAVGSDEFEAYMKEVKKMVEDREPSASIITSVMESIAYGLKFERVFLTLLGAGKQKLMGRMLLGQVAGFDPKQFVKSVSETGNCPALRAYKEGRPVFKGEPLFKDSWPIAAIPIGLGNRCIGVIYADRLPKEGEAGQDLSAKEQAAFSVLSELLERSISLQGKGT